MIRTEYLTLYFWYITVLSGSTPSQIDNVIARNASLYLYESASSFHEVSPLFDTFPPGLDMVSTWTMSEKVAGLGVNRSYSSCDFRDIYFPDLYHGISTARQNALSFVLGLSAKLAATVRATDIQLQGS